MPNVLGTDFRLRAGTYAATNLTTTYRLTAFTVQNDQRTPMGTEGAIKVAWLNPAFPPSTLPHPQAVVVARDFTRRAHGYLKWRWVFGRWTFGMYDYLLDTFFPSDAHYAAITCTHYAHNILGYYTAIMARPDESNLVMVPGGYRDIVLDFERGVKIADP